MNYHTGRLIQTNLKAKLDKNLEKIEKILLENDQLEEEIVKIQAKMYVDMTFGEVIRKFKKNEDLTKLF